MARQRATRDGAAGAAGRGLPFLAVGLVLGLLATGTGAPAAAAAPVDPRMRRMALLLEAAGLADQLETAQADVVAAQLRRSRAAGELTALRSRMTARAVAAYMRGTGASVTALVAPRAYLEVVAGKERELVAGYRSAVAGAAARQRKAETARGDVRATQSRLAAVQAALDTSIAADDARRADEARQADEARRAALARQAAAAAAARGRASASITAGATGSLSPGGYAPSPLDPGALLPRHKAATEKQLALMSRIPFGPVPATGSLPGGLAGSGQRIEGNASWYGPGFNGRPTASGAIYDQEAWTVASRDLPLGTLLHVTAGNRRVLLLVNDRGPYVDGRVLDLSAAAARALGVGGVGFVTAEVVARP